METEVVVERSTRIKEAWVDTLFTVLVGGGFALGTDSRFVSWGFALVTVLAVALVLYNGYLLPEGDTE